MDKRDCYGSDATISNTTTKDAPAVVTLGVKAGNCRSYDSFQSYNMNNENTVEAGYETELLFMRFTLLLKVQARNNTRNETWNFLQ